MQFSRSQQLLDAWPSLWSFWVFQYSSLPVCWPVGADRNTEVMQVIPDLQNLPKHSRNFSNTVLDSWRLTNIWNNNIMFFFFYGSRKQIEANLAWWQNTPNAEKNKRLETIICFLLERNWVLWKYNQLKTTAYKWIQF